MITLIDKKIQNKIIFSIIKAIKIYKTLQFFDDYEFDIENMRFSYDIPIKGFDFFTIEVLSPPCYLEKKRIDFRIIAIMNHHRYGNYDFVTYDEVKNINILEQKCKITLQNVLKEILKDLDKIINQ